MRIEALRLSVFDRGFFRSGGIQRVTPLFAVHLLLFGLVRRVALRDTLVVASPLHISIGGQQEYSFDRLADLHVAAPVIPGPYGDLVLA